MTGWQTDAACFGDTDLDAWFAPADDVRTVYAKSVCEPCKVRETCLEAAITNREPDGVWGGLTTRERVLLMRRQRRGTVRPACGKVSAYKWHVSLGQVPCGACTAAYLVARGARRRAA